ncbi:MAG TPA: protein kinase, partial [Polyangia bacterium]
MPCLSENTVQRFVEGQLADEAAAAVEQHVDECPECRGVLADLGRALGADAVAAQDPGPAAGAPGVADEPAPRLARGASVGRYIVIDPIGAGGMSVVYAAYDAELDRKVALKLVHPGAAPAAGLPEVQARLAREAQALARLSHPNVITVYEVGTRGDEIFLAMELVEGPTLAGWLAERLRTWRATVRMFLQAGAGLAAAHAAGLVHRDFKPHNVLVGPDGRARILDFGLAQPAAAPRDRPERRAAPADGAEDYRAGAGAAALTRTGARLGTPAYMAPEQHRGEAVDARTDQFSFCVALFEALHGVRPFDAGDAGDLRRAVTEGQLRAPPRDRRVPARLRRIVRRGLNVRPEDRYPTMDALLADLTRATRARWWKAAAAVAAAALVAGTALAGRAHWQRQESACLRAETRLVGVWDPERQRRGRAAFVATGLDGAAAAWAQSAARLDAYTRAWAAARDEACAATRRGTQSEEVRDLRLE